MVGGQLNIPIHTKQVFAVSLHGIENGAFHFTVHFACVGNAKFISEGFHGQQSFGIQFSTGLIGFQVAHGSKRLLYLTDTAGTARQQMHSPNSKTHCQYSKQTCRQQHFVL